MVLKPLLILSILFSTLGFNSISQRYDDAIARYEIGNSASVSASEDSLRLGFPQIVPSPRVKPFSEKPDIRADYFIIADAETGKSLYQKNSSSRVPIASTTKIMTAIVALENYKLDEVMTVSNTAASQIGSDVFLRAGEKITFEQLLYCLLLKSGNDSAYAISEHLSKEGDIKPFVALMNKKAHDLGMKNTEYHDPAGLDVTGYSSAEDLVVITRYALKNKIFRRITSTAKYTAINIDGTIAHPLENSNRLVGEYNYLGAIGVKTGYMPEAGHCLVSAVERDGHILIGVVLHTIYDTATASADESKKLQDWAWQSIEWN